MLMLLTLCGTSWGADPIAEARLEAYENAIELLQRDGGEIARTNGKEGLIQRYRSILSEFPGFPNSVLIEWQIAKIYESYDPERGEPQDLPNAVRIYDSILSRYGPEEPYPGFPI